VFDLHWLASNWLVVLPWVLYGLSEIMPLLPTKAQSVVGAIINVGKAIVFGKGKAPALRPPGEEEPK
jgi:hypothetical protein